MMHYCVWKFGMFWKFDIYTGDIYNKKIFFLKKDTYKDDSGLEPSL